MLNKAHLEHHLRTLNVKQGTPRTSPAYIACYARHTWNLTCVHCVLYKADLEPHLRTLYIKQGTPKTSPAYRHTLNLTCVHCVFFARQTWNLTYVHCILNKAHLEPHLHTGTHRTSPAYTVRRTSRWSFSAELFQVFLSFLQKHAILGQFIESHFKTLICRQC